MSTRYPLAIPDNTPMPTTQFTMPDGMIEDEARRNMKPGIYQLRHDLGIEPHEELPGRKAKTVEEHL